MLEKDIEDVVVKWAIKNGFLAPKVKFVEAGWPDRLFLGYGASIFIEFKRPGERPDPLQEYRIAEIRKHGIPAFWCDNTVEAIDLLKAAMDPPRLSKPGYPPDVEPVSCRVIPGPWTGKDEHLPGSIEDIIQQAAHKEGADRGTASPDVQRVAGGNKEVGEFRQLDLFDPSRWIEGSNACE